MRKKVAFLLIFAATVALFGCTAPQNEYIQPVKFYYLRNELSYGTADSVIHYEVFESDGHAGDFEYLIGQYLKGPRTDLLTRTFPRNVSVTEFRQEGEAAYLELSSNFSILSGLDLSIACACLTKTVTELTGATTLHISTEKELLDGSPTVSMTMDDVLLLDNSAAESTN